MPVDAPQGLIELKLKELSLEETWEFLQEGYTVVVTNYEETRGKDVLVRLDKRRHTVTQISFDVAPIEYGERYWTVHNVSINALSLHSVFLYEESLYSIEHAYSPGTIVYFDDGAHPSQVAVVDRVFIDELANVYYTLDNEEGYFLEAELFTKPLTK